MKPNLPTILKTRHAARGFRSCLRQACCLAALFFCLAGPVALHGQTGLGETWEWRNPLPQGSGLSALAESEGRLIAVGGGTVMTTTDGMSWTPRVSGTRNWLGAVAASGATVVAVGSEGDIVTSTDGGLTWALRSSNAVVWNIVIHGGGIWVAAGLTPSYPYSRRVRTSPDGLTWTAATVPDSSDMPFTGGVWTGLRFVLGGYERLATSEDGITWTPRAAGLSVQGLAWTGSRVVAVGSDQNNVDEILISQDGITWNDALTPEAGSSSISRVVWTGTQLFAWKDNSREAYTSPTGETWTRRFLSPIEYFYPGALAAAGAGTTLLVGGDRGLMLHSPDSGVTWNPVSSGVKGNINAITRFAGRWVAVGEGGSLTSSADGVAWTPASSGPIRDLRGLAWHNGLWVAVGDLGSIFTSTDGVAWTDRTLTRPDDSDDSWGSITSVIHAGSQWVATTDDEAVLTSPDGITWQERPVGTEHQAVAWNGSRLIVVGGVEDAEGERVRLSDDGGVTWTTTLFSPGGYLNGIAWTGSQFVIVGIWGRVYTSPTGDAGTWTYRTSGTNQPLMGVIAEGGGLVAVGGYFFTGPVILTSPDGVTWTPRTAPTSRGLSSISKAGSLYVATGSGGEVRSGGEVLTSPDAVTWTSRHPPTTNGLYAAAWDGAQLLVAGEAGAILASTGRESSTLDWKSVVLLPGPDLGLRLTWFSTSARVYDIESTTTLVAPWLPIPGSPRTATGPEEFIDFTESGQSAASRRFFRVRERP